MIKFFDFYIIESEDLSTDKVDGANYFIFGYVWSFLKLSGVSIWF